MNYGAILHAIGHQVLPSQPLPRGEEDFPRGDKCFKLVSAQTPNLLLNKRSIYGRFYLRVRAGHSRSINRHRELVLQGISFEIFASYEV